MEQAEIPFKIRPAVAGDAPFIFSSWLKSYRASLAVKQLNNTVFFSEHHKVIEELLKTAKTFVICPAEDSTNIYGYICAEHIDGIFVIHYIYIKHTFRKFGLAKLLINQFNHDIRTAGVCTHLTKMAERLIPKYGFLYNPYVALIPAYVEKRIKSSNKEINKEMEQTRDAIKSKK